MKKLESRSRLRIAEVSRQSENYGGAHTDLQMNIGLALLNDSTEERNYRTHKGSYTVTHQLVILHTLIH